MLEAIAEISASSRLSKCGLANTTAQRLAAVKRLTYITQLLNERDIRYEYLSKSHKRKIPKNFSCLQVKSVSFRREENKRREITRRHIKRKPSISTFGTLVQAPDDKHELGITLQHCALPNRGDGNVLFALASVVIPILTNDCLGRKGRCSDDLKFHANGLVRVGCANY